MTTLDARSDRAAAPTPVLFVLTIFGSAALVFMVEPMVAKLMLPLLGGGPSIWNTSLAFFQGMLLVGYGYAHLLQKVRSLKAQAAFHLALLVLAGLALPLHVADLFGPPDPNHPALWLLGALTASIGGPFAVLSATAPLVQSWHARTVHAETGAEPYVLYAASNLGSLIALVAYPAIVEPLTPLHGQTLVWSLAYGVFVLLIAALALVVVRRNGAQIEADTAPELTVGVGPTLRDRLIWVFLAAVPSSLMLGVTTYITTDVASAPFLWVIPLALYLWTFIIAFAAKPLFRLELVLILQAATLVACVALQPFTGNSLVLTLPCHLACFFLTALVCHQALVARRPDPAHLTEFYLWMSFGGVVGGAFNAFLAPVIFTGIWEYPLVLVLACLARPWGRGPVEAWRWVVLCVGVAAAAGAAILVTLSDAQAIQHLKLFGLEGEQVVTLLVRLILAVAVVCAFVVRSRALIFLLLIAAVAAASVKVADRASHQTSWRNFFGVVKESSLMVRGLGGDAKLLAHGTTLHGAQAQHPAYRCRPLLYYAPETPIGQVFKAVRSERPAIRIGAVGLGTGAVAAYTRPRDHLTFFEIDPQVIAIASDPAHFSYTTECARGKVDYVLGDARLTLARQPAGMFDILLIDAFSSDSVPAHLLTVEAVRGYLTHLKPDGVLILHLSNRNLDLPGPAMATAHAAGGVAMLQKHRQPAVSWPLWEASEDAVIVARNAQALAAYAADPRWSPADPHQARAWTDDYTNLVGPMISRMKQKLAKPG
jgi:spermidine synthase